MGKGSKQRRCQIDKGTFGANWDRVFGKKDEGPKFWSVGDGHETLSARDRDEAVQQWFDETQWVSAADVPENIELVGWNPDKVNTTHLGVLERLLEQLDDEYRYGADEYTEPTEAMKDAEKKFLDAVVAEYEVWNCSAVVREAAKVTDFIDPQEIDELFETDEDYT